MNLAHFGEVLFGKEYGIQFSGRFDASLKELSTKHHSNRTPQGASENLPEGLSKQGPQWGLFLGRGNFGMVKNQQGKWDLKENCAGTP